jgi:hypothetical protein
MQDYNLKPCPFCGEKPKLYEIPPHTHQIATFMPDFAGEWICECDICGQAITAGKTAEEATEKWNRRALEWFSVDKVLPLNRTHVIGFDIESGWNYPSLCFYPDTKEFLDEAYYYKPVSITHWMPYPDAPKEERDNE